MNRLIKFFLVSIIACAYLNAASVSIVYDTPGHFLYGGGYTAVPTDPNDAMFVLAASNLVIDLGGNVFSQDPSSLGVPGFKGFVIAPGVQNVTIQNGIIAGFTGTGIFVSDGCDQIFFNNVTSAFCTDAGIAMVGTTSGITNVKIQNCFVNDVLSSDGAAAHGISCINAERIAIQDCIFEISSLVPSATGAGIYLENVGGFQLERCQSVQQTASQLSAGILCKNCNVGIMNECIVYSSSTISGDGSDVAAGYFLDGCTRTILSGCQSAFSLASTGTCHAFFSQNGQKNSFNGCLGQSNIGFAGACGIHLVNELKTTIQNTVIRETISTTGTANGIKLGDGSANCYIHGNTVLDTEGVYSFGIADSAVNSSSLFTHNVSFNNVVNFAINYAGGVTLPVIEGSLSSSTPGLPTNTGGLLDNVGVNP
ncbi:MAG TPA: right-handed parallel beta-helix repeat-containing protein [Candidatus Babeliales bacterium]|nr:right-handed parallel beta-helix repeat-containing protein [Candidatus Babeliales bacterium]